jgi:hypothetical protein
MEMTQTKNRRSASVPGTTMVAVLLATVTAAGCEARRARVVAWRPADMAAPAGEPDARGARTYRVVLPPAEAGERPMRAELVFASPLDGARVDAIAVGRPERRPLVARQEGAGERVVVPLAGGPVDHLEVVLRGAVGPAPALRAARVATEMPVVWPAALGAATSGVAR